MSETDKQTNRKTERESRGETKTEKETEEVKQRERERDCVLYFYNGECLHVHIVRVSERVSATVKG